MRLVLQSLLVLVCINIHAAEKVRCHLSYGGETHLFQAEPIMSPYPVGVTAIGSYFLFRIVFEAEPKNLAAIKIYTYADRKEGATPIQLATYPYPLNSATGPYGFTGLQTVYEPVRDSELHYWCELSSVAMHTVENP